tara:strand:+ start:382 stop:651 length:270 start_codon:yes stop_codon:yes gene_type:complete
MTTFIATSPEFADISGSLRGNPAHEVPFVPPGLSRTGQAQVERVSRRSVMLRNIKMSQKSEENELVGLIRTRTKGMVGGRVPVEKIDYG